MDIEAVNRLKDKVDAAFEGSCLYPDGTCLYPDYPEKSDEESCAFCFLKYLEQWCKENNVYQVDKSLLFADKLSGTLKEVRLT